MNLNLLDQAGFIKLLKRLQGSGYSSDDDSVNVAEITGVAKIAAMASEALDAAVSNLFVSHADEALDQHDDVRGMPSDALLSTADRRSRLVAFTRALPKMIEARLDGAMDRWLGTTTGSTLSPTGSQAYFHGCSEIGHLTVSRLEPSADPQELRVIDAILRRGLPARMLSKRGAVRTATYAQDVERSVFTTTAPGSDPTIGGPLHTAPLEQFPGGTITLDEWREIQAMLLYKPYRGGAGTTTNHFTTSHTDAGANLYLEGNLTGASAFSVTNAGSWVGCMVQGWVVAHTASFSDTTASGLSHGYLGVTKMGPPSSGWVVPFLTPSGVASDIQVETDASGFLRIANLSGADRHFKMFLRRTSRMYNDTTHSREPWTNLSQFDSASVSAMLSQSQVVDGPFPYGAMLNQGPAVRRILYTGSMSKSGVDSPNLVVLDTSMDWRNRALLVLMIGDGGSNTRVLFASADGLSSSMATTISSRVFLTGSGAVANPAAAGARQMRIATDIWMWADSSTGHLMAEVKDISTSTYSHAMVMVMATPTLGFPTGTPMVSVPVAAPSVMPADLNRPQNFGVYAQGQSNGTTAITCPPLGVISDGGLPCRPSSWLVRERRGDLRDREVEVRQKLYGQRKRVISLGVAAGATIDVDAHNQILSATSSNLDQIDYRDRFLHIEVTSSSLDISLGAAVQISDVLAPRFVWALYTGPFGNQTVASGDITLTFEFGRPTANAFHSRLRVTNNAASTRYVNMVIEATGFLGLTDRRLDAQSP